MKKDNTKSNTVKDWGIYTFIAGDNDLSEFGIEDISEMTEEGAAKDVHVAVQIDTSGEFEGSVRYEITEPDFSGISHRTVIERLEEHNTGEPRFLADFARWAGERYPARKRILVVWNHGAGFLRRPTRDIGYDDSSGGDALSMRELRWALESAGYGSGSQGRLTILGFDACLMNMIEVAYEFEGLTDLVVGSQQVEPGDGWPYNEVVRLVKGDPSANAVAQGIVREYIRSYRTIGASGVTQSAIAVDRLAAVAAALDGLGGELTRVLPLERGNIRQARIKTLGYHEPTYVDAVDCVRNLRSLITDAGVEAGCSAIEVALQNAVVANEAHGAEVARSAGLSLWFPILPQDYLTRRSEYIALRCTQKYPRWLAFLDQLFAG